MISDEGQWGGNVSVDNIRKYMINDFQAELLYIWVIIQQ